MKETEFENYFRFAQKIAQNFLVSFDLSSKIYCEP